MVPYSVVGGVLDIVNGYHFVLWVIQYVLKQKKYILQEMIYTFFIHCLLRRKGNGHDSFTESLMGGEAGILKLEI